MSMMNELILILGGVGFIGSYLCEWLLVFGYEVLVLDNFFIGYFQYVVYFDLYLWFMLIQYDIMQFLLVVVEYVGCVFNLVCLVSLVYYQKNLVDIILISVFGVWQLLEFVDCSGVWLLQVLISEVYGDLDVYLQGEDYVGYVNLIGLCLCYDEGKCCVEVMYFVYCCECNILMCIVCFFNSYGLCLWFGDGCVVSNFIVQVLCGDLLMIYGDGQQICSFCYVDDIVIVLLKLMELDIEGLVNIGNLKEYIVLEFIELVLKLIGSCLFLVYCLLLVDDLKWCCLDIVCVCWLLDWKLRVGLEDGLKQIIDYFCWKFDLLRWKMFVLCFVWLIS